MLGLKKAIAFVTILFTIISLFLFFSSKNRKSSPSPEERGDAVTENIPVTKDPRYSPKRASTRPRFSEVSSTGNDMQERIGSGLADALSNAFKNLKNQSSPKIAETEYTVDDLISILIDDGLPLTERRSAAWRLAKTGSDQAIEALKQILIDSDSPPYLVAAIAEGLGHSPHSEAGSMIHSILSHENTIAVRGAVRGLSEIGDAYIVEVLEEIVLDQEYAKSVRMEAVLALGKIDIPRAYQGLINSMNEIDDNEIKEEILAGLGNRDFAETKAFFTSYLQSEETTELRVSAVSSLGDASGDVMPFLFDILQDSNSEVREAAASAIATLDESGADGALLTEFLINEPNVEVRKRLYQALDNQENIDIDPILPRLMAETDQATRLAGFELLAGFCNENQDSNVREHFDQIVVPELASIALQETSLHPRLGSILALRRAKTPASIDALEIIVAKSNDSRIINAAEAALPRSLVKY